MSSDTLIGCRESWFSEDLPEHTKTSHLLYNTYCLGWQAAKRCEIRLPEKERCIADDRWAIDAFYEGYDKANADFKANGFCGLKPIIGGIRSLLAATQQRREAGPAEIAYNTNFDEWYLEYAEKYISKANQGQHKFTAKDAWLAAIRIHDNVLRPKQEAQPAGEIPVVDDLAVFDLICEAIQSCDTSVDSQANAVLAKLQPYLREPNREISLVPGDDEIAIIEDMRRAFEKSIGKDSPSFVFDHMFAAFQVVKPYLRYREGELVAVPMILYCPLCRNQHVDEGEWATTRHHKTHLCEHCETEFRPSNTPTVGVKSLSIEDAAPRRKPGKQLEALKYAANIFRQYEKHHAAKPDVDKAMKNSMHAEICEAAIKEIEDGSAS